MPQQWLVILPVAMLLVVLPVVWWARRGRRIDDHPLCRKCHFDLFGKPPESTRCPECGRDVTLPRSIRIGNRQSRRRVLAGLSPLIVLPAAWLGVLGYGMFAGVDWNRHKPVGWLVREAQGEEISLRDRALAELLRRANENGLSATQIADVSDAALAHQGDVNQPWLPAWGDLVERLHTNGRLPAEAWTRYARQALATSLKLWHRTYMRRGETMVVQVRSDPPRLSTSTFWISWDAGDGGPDDYSGYPVEKKKKTEPATPGRAFRWPEAQSRYHSCGLFAPTPEVEAKLSDGPQSVRVTLNLHVYDSASSAKPVLEEELKLHGKWDLHPKTDPLVRLVTDAKLREAVRASISDVNVSVAVWPAAVWPHLQEATVRFKAGFRPVHLAVVPILRAGSQEWSPAMDMSVGASIPANRSQSIKAVIGIDARLPDMVDVVLRPMPEKMKGSWAVWEIWGEDIVIPNVKVQR